MVHVNAAALSQLLFISYFCNKEAEVMRTGPKFDFFSQSHELLSAVTLQKLAGQRFSHAPENTWAYSSPRVSSQFNEVYQIKRISYFCHN